jgi:Transcriptional regulators
MNISTMPGHLIRRLHQLSTQVFSAHMQDADLPLTPVQFAALDAIRSQPGIDQAGVAALIAYDRATIGGVIDRLEKKGLVVRTVSKTDRRARQVSLTPRGEALFNTLLPRVAALQTEILPGLTDAERQQFLALASKALAYADGSGTT